MEARKIVLPGELIEEKSGKRVGSGAYVEDNKVFAMVLGIPMVNENQISVIPLSGVYLPQLNDKVVGVISEMQISGWIVDINSPYVAFLPVSEAMSEFVDTSKTDLSRYYDVDNVVYCKISRVTKNKAIQASMRTIDSRKLYGGILIKVTPSKVPRVIGKAGSMINLIKTKTGCEIVVGQNGVIWIKGNDKSKAIEAILTIEKEAHAIGLTEKIEKMLGGALGGAVDTGEKNENQ